MKRLISFLAICLMASYTIITGNDPDHGKFTVAEGNLTTEISSDGLKMTVRLVRPSTMPVCSDPAKWNLLSVTSEQRKLAGVAGKAQIAAYQTNIGILEYETWISFKSDLIALRQTFTNKTKKSVQLGYLYPLYIEGKDGMFFGNVNDWLILEQFRRKNEFPSSVTPVAESSAGCDPFLVINNGKGSGKNLFIGFQTYYLHLADLSISFDKELNLEKIAARCDFEDSEIPPDGSRTSQWVIMSTGSDAGILIDEYVERIRDFHNVPEPLNNAPSVYCTWYYHADNYDEELFRHDIAQFRKEHLPFDVFLIDECWGVNDWGDFEPNKNFPSGMKWVAEQINSAGYTAGIWTAPFLVDGESSLAGDHPGWLLRDGKGSLCTFNMNDRDHYILDLTFPGVCEYLEEQFRKISRDWGYGYFKFDFMRSVFLDTDQQFYDRTATSLEAYRRGLEAIRRGTGPDAYISVCGGHYGASLGIANSQRSGSDVKSQWNRGELPKYRQNILRTWMAGLWHVDPDAMMVRRQEIPEPLDKRGLTTGLFTDDEAFTNAINQFIGGNLVTFTEDFAKIDSERKMLYRHVVPSVNSASTPLDLFNPHLPEMMLTHIAPDLIQLGKWNMLTVVNWSDETRSYKIAMDEKSTGGLNGSRFIVFDFEKQKILAWLNRGEDLTIDELLGHHSKVLKIVAWDGSSPMFLGTDLNFSCGGVEISDLKYLDGSFEGTLNTGWHLPVKLTFIIPAGESYRTEQVTTVPGQKRFLVTF